ncbi:adenylyl-sulfate kinase [Bacillus cereus]|uniref:adenylyl-sulfate kinase n=1 Tax=Bacillus sp. AFS023182 TaxID=2033492 RepID=UPI000BF920B0|nr:adenylyl-sulfate kinase [Bacillus sp. AFS023182]PFD96924.1 adenylyl-sulfate kinase [Bacillus sp. AFS023182]PGY04979.1 adenylyl-sulfate kinase [Bacillus cereus]
MDAKVIAISGVTAGGKTTLVNQLVKEFPNAYALYFDNYEIENAPDVKGILNRPSDYFNAYQLDSMINDLKKAKNKSDYIFLDHPIGYENKQIGMHIDKVIYIKTPLDITFARYLLRDFSDSSASEILEWAKIYLGEARPMFITHEEIVSKHADYIIDGTLGLEEKIAKIKQLLT